jgi:hypothetical protein
VIGTHRPWAMRCERVGLSSLLSLRVCITRDSRLDAVDRVATKHSDGAGGGRWELRVEWLRRNIVLLYSFATSLICSCPSS